jgi:hypothetical protein
MRSIKKLMDPHEDLAACCGFSEADNTGDRLVKPAVNEAVRYRWDESGGIRKF